MIKKFKVTVTRTDEYTIEIDESIYNKEWRKEFAKFFYELDSTGDIAKDLATFQARNGNDYVFIEGYGYVNRDGKLPFSWEDYDQNHQELPQEQKRQAVPGLNIITEYDDDYETDIEELNS